MDGPRQVLECKLSKVFTRYFHSRPSDSVQRLRNDDSTRRGKLLQTGRYVDRVPYMSSFSVITWPTFRPMRRRILRSGGVEASRNGISRWISTAHRSASTELS